MNGIPIIHIMNRDIFCSPRATDTQSFRIFVDRCFDSAESESADTFIHYSRSCCPDRYHYPKDAELYHPKVCHARRTSIERKKHLRSYHEQNEQLFQKRRENRKIISETGKISGKKDRKNVNVFIRNILLYSYIAGYHRHKNLI